MVVGNRLVLDWYLKNLRISFFCLDRERERERERFLDPRMQS